MRAVIAPLGSLIFPAASIAVVTVDVTCDPSALNISSAGHPSAAIPESASAQVNRTRTSALYHPAPLGAVVAAAVIVGFVLSTRTVYDALPVLPATSVQV